MEAETTIIWEWPNPLVRGIQSPIWDSEIAWCRNVDVNCRLIEAIERIRVSEIETIVRLKIEWDRRLQNRNSQIRINCYWVGFKQ